MSRRTSLCIWDVHLVIVGRLQVLGLGLAEIIDNQVVGYACNPGGEMSVFDIASLLDGRDGFDEGILEDVIGQFFVFYRMVYVHVNAVFVTLQEFIKGLVCAIDIQRDQLVIALVIINLHYYILLVNKSNVCR